jgi:tRNA(fMet)-specific endonuclease VapC
MLVLDTNLLSDYLNGSDEARTFLEQREHVEWAVSSIVLYEALMGAVYGYIDASPRAVHPGMSAAM